MPIRELTDEEIVSACIKADAEAWSALVHRYRKLIYNIALQAGLNPDDAADVSQIVFVTIYRNLHLLEHPARLRSWISMIARREAWRIKRRLTSTASREDSFSAEPGAETSKVTEVAASGPLPDEAMERLEDRFLVHGAFERLDDRCRQLLERLFLRTPPLSYEETARELGIRRGSIGPTRARCLEKLRKFLEEAGF
jgi:RNA polymerase sigma factor (sigma-70 family)